MTGVYKIIKKGNKVYKYINKNNEIGYIIYQSLKNLTKSENIYIDYFNNLIKNGHLLPHIGQHIVKGFLFKSKGDYYSPYIDGLLLSNLDTTNMKFVNLFHILFSIEELLYNLILYNKNIDALIGDWAIHNLIMDNNTGVIINIDLEGLYTYSKLGPTLKWNKKENKISFIHSQFSSIKKDIIFKLSENSSKLNNIPYITLIILPNTLNINWLYPFLYKNYKDNIKNRIFNMEFGDLQGYKTNIFSVYFLFKNQKKISQIIIPNNKISPLNSKLFFRFKASLESSYEHPIAIKIKTKKSPLRSILEIVKSDGDFYIKKFSKID